MNRRPRRLPQISVMFEDALQKTWLLPTVGAHLLLGQDATEEGAEALRVREDGVQPGDEPDSEDLVSHHVTVDHHDLQSLDTCLRHRCEAHLGTSTK